MSPDNELGGKVTTVNEVFNDKTATMGHKSNRFVLFSELTSYPPSVWLLVIP